MAQKSHDKAPNTLRAGKTGAGKTGTGKTGAGKTSTEKTGAALSDRTAAIRRGPVSWIRDLSDGRMGAKYLLGALLTVLCIVAMLLPTPYALRYPGLTLNVLGEVTTSDGQQAVITIDGAQTYRDSGKLLMTTVSVAGANTTAQNWQTLMAYFTRSAVVLPREAVVPYGTTSEQYTSTSNDQMTTAEDSASSNALDYIVANGLVSGFSKDGVSVTIQPGEVGGPSAGLMYTLGVIDELTPADETGGLTIAGTGTMESDGTVGAIGGIRQKLLGARRDGATWFLAPATNCDEVVDNVPDGMRDVAVTNLDDAYKALVAIGKGEGDSLPRCSVDVYNDAIASGSASQ